MPVHTEQPIFGALEIGSLAVASVAFFPALCLFNATAAVALGVSCGSAFACAGFMTCKLVNAFSSLAGRTPTRSMVVAFPLFVGLIASGAVAAGFVPVVEEMAPMLNQKGNHCVVSHHSMSKRSPTV